jgi:putative radical SAM enzyme (TIGR03279 family)
VHATEPALRRELLNRADIPDILPQIDRLAELGIEMHTQIVLLPGRNDGPHLRRTIADLAERTPSVRSIGVVPVGLTRYHRGGCRVYRPEEARQIVDDLSPLQAAYRAQVGVSLLYLSDEWYLLAGKEVPEEAWYDGYAQVENGIGLVRRFLEDRRRLNGKACSIAHGTLVCGTLIAPLMERVVGEWAAERGSQIEVVPVVNRLFGETVTVSGLLGGAEVLAALRGRELGERVYLPRAMFALPPQKDGSRELRTLDDLTGAALEEALGRPVVLADLLSELCVPPLFPPRTTHGEEEEAR